MQKYFVAYRFTGEDPIELEARMGTLLTALRQGGIEPYCNLFEEYTRPEAGLTARQILDEGFKELDQSDGLFVLIASSDKSEGMLMEIGYAYAKGLPIIVARQKNASTYVDQMANTVIEWEDETDLTRKLADLKVTHD